MHNIDFCEGGLQLADIGTNNVGEPDLTTKYGNMDSQTIQIQQAQRTSDNRQTSPLQEADRQVGETEHPEYWDTASVASRRRKDRRAPTCGR